MTASSYHDTVNVLQGLCQPAPSPFERSEWFALLAESGLTPLVVLASEGNSSAALALTEANGRIEPLRNWYSFTWRQLAPEGPAGERLLVEIAAQLRRRSHRVTLWPVPEEDGSASLLTRSFREAGWAVEQTRCDDNHVLPVNGRSFAEYWAQRPGKMRTTLKRKAKKVECTILESFDAEAWVQYEAIYAQSWKVAEETPQLLRRFAEQEGSAGRIRLALAMHNGLPVAAQFWTVENGTAYIHKLAHLESHKNLSAGTTLTAALFEHVIDKDRVTLVDFGTGNDAYKSDWMEEVRPRFQVDCLDPAQPKAWAPLAKRAVRKLAPSRTQG